MTYQAVVQYHRVVQTLVYENAPSSRALLWALQLLVMQSECLRHNEYFRAFFVSISADFA